MFLVYFHLTTLMRVTAASSVVEVEQPASLFEMRYVIILSHWYSLLPRSLSVSSFLENAIATKQLIIVPELGICSCPEFHKVRITFPVSTIGLRYSI
jgi:hypothetical protein